MKKSRKYFWALAGLLFLSLELASSEAEAIHEPLTPMPPVQFHGEPIFPIGCYDMVCRDTPKGELVDPGFLAAGGNFAVVGALGLPGHPFYNDFRQPVLFKQLDALSSHPEYDSLALLVCLDWPLIYNETKNAGGRKVYHPLNMDQISSRSVFLADDLRKLSRYPSILGYYLDEPENALYPYYEEQMPEIKKAKKDQGLAELVAESSRWLNRLIRKEHPQALLVPGLGWWSTYDYCAEMYDIQNPAHYPSSVDNLAEVCYDATLAVNAARRAGGNRTVIYSPAMFDQMDTGWKYAVMTREQERYVCFAPITRGAMGIWGWRLLRCTPKYRQEVIYPVMQEISELSHFFLGEWHDGRISSSRDTSSVPYLQAFKERVRMVVNEEDAPVVQVKDAVPDVCHCLRRDPSTGEYLLLLVSNLRETATVKFTYDRGGLPRILTDFFTRIQVSTDGSSFQVDLEPHAVRAYRFFEK